MVLVMDPRAFLSLGTCCTTELCPGPKDDFKLKPPDIQLVQKALWTSSVAEGTRLWEQALWIPFQWSFGVYEEVREGHLVLHKQTSPTRFSPLICKLTCSSMEAFSSPCSLLNHCSAWVIWKVTFSCVLMHLWIRICLLLLICLCYFSPQVSDTEPPGQWKVSFSQNLREYGKRTNNRKAAIS